MKKKIDTPGRRKPINRTLRLKRIGVRVNSKNSVIMAKSFVQNANSLPIKMYAAALLASGIFAITCAFLKKNSKAA